MWSPVTRPEALALLILGDPHTPAEARTAYRKAALRAHPDRGGDEALMKRVNAAYELLSGKGGGLFEVDVAPERRQKRRPTSQARTREEQARELWICRLCASVYPGGGLGTRCNARTAHGQCSGEVRLYVPHSGRW
jgi:hypothetical protein